MAMRVEPRLKLLDWTTRRRSLLVPGKPFDLAHHKYLKAIYEDDSPEIVLMKAGQVGTSEYLISSALYAADELSATALYVMPTDQDVSDFSAQRFGPAVQPEVSAYLASVVISASDGGADKVGLKRISNGWLYLRGAKVQPDGSAHQLHSVAADVVILDEYDLMDRRAPVIARERLGHSSLKWLRVASTPTYPETGIHAEYLATDMREWQIKCEHCGAWQTITIEHCVIESDDLGRPTKWHGDDSPYLACRKCSQPMDRLGEGNWVALSPSRSSTHGYHLPGLASPFKSLVDILGLSRALDAKPRGLMSTDETERQQTMNQGLGLPYLSRTSTHVTDSLLDACCRDYAHIAIAKGEGGSFMGIDVGRAIHVVIRDGTGRQRYAGAVASFAEAAVMMTTYRVIICVVDALPETRAARAFQSDFSDRVWLCYYGRQKTGSKDVKEAVWNPSDRTVDADRTRTLDATYSLFLQAAKGESGNTLPMNIRATQDYYAHLKAPVRQLVRDALGGEVAVYIESGADHYAHAENYCHIASLAPTGWVRGS